MKIFRYFVMATCIGLALFSSDGSSNLASVPPGPTTPTSLFMTLNSVEISIDARKPYKTIFGCSASDSACVNNPVTIDVVANTGLPESVFGKGTPPFDEYKAVRLTLLSDNGTYTGFDPCTGDPASDATIQLPEGENGKVTINYMVPHPVLGLQTGFRQMQPLTVGTTPIDLRLVFTATHSVVCASSKEPLRAISGDPTQLAKPLGVALDSTRDEIAVVNGAPTKNRITFYQRIDDGDPQPLRSIEGDVTGLNSPIGLYIDTGAVPNEIGVANNGNNSIAIYDRQAVIDNTDPTTRIANVPPLRTISGSNTGLRGPGMIALDSAQSILVANGGNNSVTIYDRNDVLNAFLGQLIGNTVLDAGKNVSVGDTLLLRLNGDTVDRTITFDTSLTNDGSALASQIQRLVQALSTSVSTSLQAAYSGFTASFDGSRYTLTSGAAALDSAVIVTGGTKANDFMLTQSAGAVNTGVSDVSPIHTIGRNFVITASTNDVINLTEAGGVGNVNATIPEKAYTSGADLASAVEAALNKAVTTGTNFTVTYDDITGLFTITVTALGNKVSSVTLNWDAAATTAKEVLGFHPVPSAALFSGSSVTSDFGDLTEMNIPCGIYVDPVNNEIGVANNGNNSITIYGRNDTGNITPKRAISGHKTDLSGPCGIALYLDPGGISSKDEIIVANAGDDSVRIYSRIANGNVPPLRTIKGDPTELSNPVGIALYLDPSVPRVLTKDEIVVANSGHDGLTIHKRYDNTVQLKSLPTMIQSDQQQTLFSQYSYSYSGTTPITAGTTTPSAPASFDGYRFVWKITDERIRQKQDASSAYLFPPGNTVFQLTNGEVVPYLPMDCTQLIPFIILELSTNCPPSPLIHSPLPVAGGEYRVASVLFSQVTITKFPTTSTPLEESEFPRLVPTVKVFTDPNRSIDNINWRYVNEEGVDLPSPLIFSQQFQINLTKPFGEILSCYQPVQGNNPNLVFDSGPIPKDVSRLTEIKNNKCPIYLNDVDNIVFTVTDALSNSFIYTWKIM